MNKSSQQKSRRARINTFTPNNTIKSILYALIVAAALPSSAYAHRGSPDEIDPCRVHVGDERVHFAAYTEDSSGKSYCKAIPSVGMTHLVFDYEGKKLRQASIEFEITKEPEGTRIFYRAPEKSKTGTVDGSVDFTPFGAGNYLAHVTLVQNDEKLDTHIPFSVGIEDGESPSPLKKFLFTFLVSAAIIYSAIKIARGKDDSEKA